MPKYVALVAAAILAGCKPPPAPPVACPPVSTDVSPLRQDSDLFHNAEELLARGAYRDAAQAYGAYLKQHPEGVHRDGALVRLATLHAIAGPPHFDRARTRKLLRQVLAHGDTPWRHEARLLLDLRAQVGRLRNDLRQQSEEVRSLRRELELLKKIDLEQTP